MITQEQLQELLAYQANGDKGDVVSIYLDTDTSQEPMETIKLRARAFLKEANLKDEAGAKTVERYLDHSYDWSKPGLALFVNAAGDFFRSYPTAVSFRNRVRTGHKPYVKPLAHLLDHYAHYGVILIDRIGARFFEYHLGELQETAGYMGEEVRKLKQGGGSSAQGMRGGQHGARAEEEVAQRNLREAAAAAARFFQNKPIRRLFLGGTDETVAQFRDLLSRQLQSCLAGTFNIDMNAGEHEVRAISLQLLQTANAHREKKLVQKMLTAEASGNNAVLGLDDTLQAICEKRVETLIISDGYRTPGYVNEESEFVVANLAKSPMGIDALTEVEDVIDAAVAYSLAQGAHVEIVSDNPSLEAAGRIGSILRY